MSEESKIRKQFYITPDQERALKEHARTEGVSEAEIVREALGRYLQRRDAPMIHELRRQAMDELMSLTEKIARQHRFPEGYKFCRDELYQGREKRWLKGRDTE